MWPLAKIQAPKIAIQLRIVRAIIWLRACIRMARSFIMCCCCHFILHEQQETHKLEYTYTHSVTLLNWAPVISGL